jgi:outer membrane protein assembly factor BamB
MAVVQKSAFAVFALLLSIRAEDWPQFRGPDGEGHSAAKSLALTWSETEHIQWKTAIPGRGWSSPSILNGRIWVTSSIGDSLHAIALDQKSGKILVDKEVFAPGKLGPQHAKNTHASPTPVLEGDRVYVHFGTHGTAALNTNGDVIWKARMEYSHMHGTGGSPVLYKDLLIFSCDGTDVQFVVALDKATGKVRWKTPRNGAMAYSTPLIITVNGKDQLISPGALRGVAYDPLNGKELWSVSYGEGFSNVPRPVFAHGLLFLPTGFNRADLLAVKPGGEVVWTYKRSVPLTPSPIVAGDELYIVSDNGIATCFDAKSGAVHWQQRLGGNFSASPVAAAGRIYFQNEEGLTTVIEAGKTFKKLASNQLDGSTLASLAVSNDTIYLRTGTHIYSICCDTK